jgi:hypothetical protein
MAFFGKESGQFEPVGFAPNGDLPPFFFFCEAVFDGPLDVKILNVSLAFRFPQRDENSLYTNDKSARFRPWD